MEGVLRKAGVHRNGVPRMASQIPANSYKFEFIYLGTDVTTNGDVDDKRFQQVIFFPH